MRERLTVTMNEEKLISFARSYLAENFPNPGRIGCPPVQALQRLAKHPTQRDLSITEHLSHCSPCFLQYQELLAALKLEKPPMRNTRGVLSFSGILSYVFGVAFIVAAAVCFVLLRANHRKPSLPG